MLDFLKKQKRILYIMGLVICAALFVVLGKKSIKTEKIENIVYSVHAHNDKKTDTIYYQRLVRGDEIRQTFAPDTKTDGLSFCFHKGEDKVLAGQTFLEIIKRSSGEKVYEDVYDNTRLPMDELVNFGLHDVSLEVGTEYEIVLTSDVENEKNAPEIYLQRAGAYNGKLVINGTDSDTKALCLGVFKHSNMPDKIFNIILALTIVVLGVVLLAAFAFKMPLHRVFIIACIGFGSIYMLVVAPGKGCDSAHHFRVAYDYSNRLLFKGNANDGLLMREDDFEFYKRNFKAEDTYHGLMTADAFMDLRDTASVVVRDDNMVNTGMDAPKENFVPYIPYITGLVLGRLFHLGSIFCVYLARFLGVVAFALMIALAIKIIPVGKEMLALVALMPMTLQEYSAFSYDGMCIAAAFLFTACWLRCMHGMKPDNADDSGENAVGTVNSVNAAARAMVSDRMAFVTWIVSAVLLGACKKGTYIFFLLLLVAVKKVHMSWKKKAAVAGSMAASAVIFNVVQYAVVAAEAFGLVAMAADGKYMPGSSYTLSYAVEHPWEFLLMCIGSLIEKADYYLGSIIGTHLSANIQTIPLAIVVPFLVIILMVSLESEKERACADRIVIKSNEKLAMCISCLMSCAVMFFMMQVSTPVGWNIDGVTGRYFLPVLPLILLCLHGNGMTINEITKKRAMALFYCWHVVEVFYAVWAIVIR